MTRDDGDKDKKKKRKPKELVKSPSDRVETAHFDKPRNAALFDKKPKGREVRGQ